MRRWSVGLLGLVVLLFGTVGAAPAWADERIELSWDGVDWTSRLQGQLFDPDVRRVPGDAEVEDFHVRNTSSDDATLTVDVLTDDMDGLLADEAFDLTVRVGDGAWQSLSGDEKVDQTRVAAGEQTRVQARIAFDFGATNATQNARIGLQFLLTLEGTDVRAVVPEEPGAPTEPAAPAEPATPTDPDTSPTPDTSVEPGVSETPVAPPGSQLPYTGAWVTWLATLAAALIGVGLALVIPRRQESADG